MNSIQDQSGTADGEIGNIESSDVSTYAERELDLEASSMDKEGITEGKSKGRDVEGGANESQGPTDDPTSVKDFPDLAPSKSMDFPDGTVPPRGFGLIDRWKKSLVDGRRRILMSILLFR